MSKKDSRDSIEEVARLINLVTYLQQIRPATEKLEKATETLQDKIATALNAIEITTE